MSDNWLASYPQYLQLLAVGFLWINLHCAGMCGPLVVGLNLGGVGNPEGDENVPPGRWQRLRMASGNLASYQLGRSVTYAIMGGLAGWAGSVLQRLIADVTRIAGLVVAAGLIGAGLVALLRPTARIAAMGSSKPGRLLNELVQRLRGTGGPKKRFLLGIVLGFLPCMIPVWVLGLAASTQSPFHGAALMVMLVWMTSFVIFGFGMAPAIASARTLRWQSRLLPLALMLSGTWLGLIGLAANGWIEHQSVGFTLGGRGYAIMFW